ncbi:MAG: hypothetical protein LBF88_06630 [Planctomycetaceae bacterium]|jgi:hypothetical protein|nr:hypothetical protein [Planctomycetaceae bacterium]
MSNEKKQSRIKPFIIANPIYDTVFKRLMENLRIVKFFLSTILGQPVTAVDVLPQEFSHKGNDETDSEDNSVPYSMYRVDFMATIQTNEGEYRKVLIEVQKSLGAADVTRFRKYLGEQYSKKDIVIVDKSPKKNSGNNSDKKTEGQTLPITTIYILGNKLAEIKCSCLKVGRTYTDMLTNETVNEKSDFVEKLTHDSYIIQAGRITDNRYVTSLEKLLSIFEQSYFVSDGSEALKEYRYQPLPDDEEIKLITETLHEMGVDPEERKLIENEAEYIRTIDDTYGYKIKELTEALEEKDKENAELKEKLAELERLLRNK